MLSNHQELNTEIIDDLLDVLGSGFFELMDEQITQANLYMEELSRLIEKEDVNGIIRISHSLKSSVGQIGLQGIHAIAKKLEYQGREDVQSNGIMGDACWKTFAELQSAYLPAVCVLRDYAVSRYKG